MAAIFDKKLQATEAACAAKNVNKNFVPNKIGLARSLLQQCFYALALHPIRWWARIFIIVPLIYAVKKFMKETRCTGEMPCLRMLAMCLSVP